MDMVGGISTPLKNVKVNWDADYSKYMGNNTCSSHHQPASVDNDFQRQKEGIPPRLKDETLIKFLGTSTRGS